MRSVSTASLALATFFIGSILPAQNVRLFGKVVLDRTSKKLVLDCTKIPLRSTNVDLAKLGSGVFEMRGTDHGTLKNPDIEVLSAKPSASVFRISGTSSIGTKLSFEVKDSSAAVSMLTWLSVQPSYLPMEPFTRAFSGTWLLDLRSLLFLAFTPIVNGSAKVYVPIPKLLVLVGIPVHGQAALWYKQLPIVFINTDCRILKRGS